MVTYHVNTEVMRHGQRVDVPDDAIDVSVESLGAGLARITYVQPMRSLPVHGPSDQSPSHEGFY